MNMEEQKNTAEWTCHSIVSDGAYHRGKNMPGQDAAAWRAENDVVAAALADGANGTYADIGAQITAEASAQYLTEHFDALWAMQESRAGTHILSQIRHALFPLCEKKKMSMREVGSTLVALAIKNEHCLLIHLGDGWITARERTNKPRKILSCPENGINPSYTYLTSDRTAAKKIRVRKCSAEEFQAFYLSSDGWKSGDNAENWMEQMETAVRAGHTPKNYQDDVSAVLIQRMGMDTAAKQHDSICYA